MKSFYLSHGSPMLLHEDYGWKETYKNIGDRIVKEINPDVIVISSPHYVSLKSNFKIAANDPHKIIYDFYGFPDELYKYGYSARNDNDTLERIVETAKENGVNVMKDFDWGLDHGAWIPLSFMVKDIPIISISIKPGTIEDHIKMGKIINQAMGKRRGVFIGTGSPTHRLDRMYFGIQDGESKFDLVLMNYIEQGKKEEILNLPSDPLWREAQPEGGLLPMYMAIGASGSFKGNVLRYDKANYGVSMIAMEFFGH